MARSWISLAILLAVVAGLAAWVLNKPAGPARASHALSQLKPHEVQRIRLERVAQGAAPALRITLERSGDGWRMTEPVQARADSQQVERLLTLLDAQSVARYPAKDLERYGLEAPRSALTLNDETIRFGGVNETTREQYVLSAEHVYAIPIVMQTSVPREVGALISRSLFAADEKPVRFELQDFSAALEDGTWSFTSAGEDPGPDERNGWVAAWRQATALKTAPHDGRKPAETLAIELEGGRTVELGVLEREPELVIVRMDEGIQYHFLPGTARRLLAAPGPSAPEGRGPR